jgi:TonB family protein
VDEITPPTLVTFVAPTYPASEAQGGRQAKVVLKLVVDKSGKVTKVEVKGSAGAAFDSAAKDAAMNLLFSPAHKADGTPVAAAILFRYEFTLTPKAPPPPQQSLTLRVRADGEAPIAGARIHVVFADRTTRDVVTGSTGEISLSDVPAGALSLSIDAAGMETLTSDENVGEGEALELVYRPLRRSGGARPEEPMEEVRVRGARPAREVTRRTLTRREIERIPGTNGDALRSLESMPGVARPSAGPGAGLLIVRGSAPADSKTFVNGTEIPLTYHFGGLSSVVPTELLEKIDFYPGNFSAQYGRAMGGIVDVGLRSPKSDGFHGMGQVDLIDARVLAEGPVPILTDTTFLVAGRRSWIDVTLGPLLKSAGVSQAPVYYDYQAMLERRIDARSRLRLTFFGSDDRFAIESSTGAGPGGATTGGNFGLQTSFYRGQLAYKNQMSEADSLSFTLGAGQTTQNFGAGAYFFQNTSTDLSQRLELSHRFGKMAELHAGTDVSVGSYDVNTKLPALPAEGDADNQPFSSRPARTLARHGIYTRPATYLELAITPLPALRILPGVRMDYDRDSRQVDIAPRLTARYDVKSGFRRTTVKGGVGAFYQPPQPQEITPPLGTSGLKTNRAIHYSVGVEQEVTERIDASVEGFYKDLDRLVVGSSQGGYNNAGTGTAYGLELLVKYKPDARFFGWLAYTLSRSTRTDGPGQAEHLASFDETHILTVLGSYRIGSGWEAGARFRVISGNPTTASICGGDSTNCDAARTNALYYGPSGTYVALPYGSQGGERLPLFHQLDVRVDKKWQFQRWSLAAYADVQNVYNHRTSEGITYNYNYTQRSYIQGLTIIPSLGLRGEF